MSKAARFRSISRLTSAGFLPIFVGILCTNLAGQISALAGDAALTPVASITKALTNQQITVQAVISSIRPPTSERAPYVVTLTQGDASTPLVFWSEMQTQLGSKITTGNVIRAKVKVSTYHDQIQLRIASADAIEVVSGVAASAAPTAPAASTPTAIVIGRIKVSHVDRLVVISGTISGSDKIDKGLRLRVQDATGEIPVVLGETALTGLVVAELQPGRAITVTGPVKMYEGKPAIIPAAPGAVSFAPR